MPLYPTPTHTRTEVCNHALAYVRQSLITDFDGDTSKSGIYCRLFWQQALEECLEEMGWTFATRRLILAPALQDVPAFGVDAATDRAYQLPEDFLLILYTEPNVAAWRIEADRFITDAGEIGIVYVAHQGDTSKLSAKFRGSLALHLAAKLAMPMTGDRRFTQDIAELAVDSMARTLHSDSKQSSRAVEPFDNLTRVRV